MPKNKGKGGKGKRKGKRNKGKDEEKRDLRFKEFGEEYGQVRRILGNCRVEVYCFDGKARLAHVRGKFKKRVWINKDDFVLIGLREYQDGKGDIIHKFTTDEARLLQSWGEIPNDKAMFDDDISDDENKAGGVVGGSGDEGSDDGASDDSEDDDGSDDDESSEDEENGKAKSNGKKPDTKKPATKKPDTKKPDTKKGADNGSSEDDDENGSGDEPAKNRGAPPARAAGNNKTKQPEPAAAKAGPPAGAVLDKRQKAGAIKTDKSKEKKKEELSSAIDGL